LLAKDRTEPGAIERNDIQPVLLRRFRHLRRGQKHRTTLVNTRDDPSVEPGPWMSDLLIEEFLRDKYGGAKSDDPASMDRRVALKNSGKKCGMAKEFLPNLMCGI